MRSFALCLSLCVIGCGGGGGGGGVGGNGTPAADLGHGGGGDLAQSSSSGDLSMTASTDMAGASALCCGQPGDKGNELGVGQYCTGFDCTGMANLCANLGDPQLHFCTMVCQMGGNCGTGATCQCQGGQCGCFPDACLSMPSSC